MLKLRSVVVALALSTTLILLTAGTAQARPLGAGKPAAVEVAGLAARLRAWIAAWLAPHGGAPTGKLRSIAGNAGCIMDPNGLPLPGCDH
jgi:hypothetical protein